MKSIWIVNFYSAPPIYSGNPRHLEFAEYLNKKGYAVKIISAGYLRDQNIDLVPHGKKYLAVKYGAIDFIHIAVRKYFGNGLARMQSIFQFAWRLYKYSSEFGKPDTIYHNIHAPFDYPVVWCAKKLGANYFAEAWDLWPESFVRFGLISQFNPFLWAAYYLEKKMYERARRVVFTLEGGMDYLKEKKWLKGYGGKISSDRVFYINNGVNINIYEENYKNFKINDIDLLNNEYFKVVYLGAINLVNEVKKLVEAAALLQEYSQIKFLIYGDGDDRQALVDFCIENGIKNVMFKERWIPFKYVPFVLSNSSLNILNYQKDFGKYGISSGKFFQYLAAGKPICSNIKMNYCMIEKNKLGVAEDLEIPRQYADAILSIAGLSSTEYNIFCDNVRKTAEVFDYKKLSAQFFEVINV